MSAETPWAAYVYQHASEFRMGTEAHHNLGDISRDTADVFCVEDEFESEYVGRWLTGFGFVGVRFPKATTRPLTVVELDWLAAHPVGLS